MNARTVLALVALLALPLAFAPERAAAQVVYAPVAAAPAGSHVPGFYARLTLGLGFSHTRFRLPGSDLFLNGVAGDVSVSLGVMLPGALAIHGDLVGASAFEPSVRLEGSSSSGTASNVTYTTGGLGVGLTRYLPSNVYLTAGLGLAVARLEDSGFAYDSDLGGYLTLGFGKEWLLMPQLGVGIMGRVTATRIGAEGDANLTTIVPSISGSISFN